MKTSTESELDLRIAQLRERLDRPVVVALDGRSGVGKSAVAGALAARHGGCVITADDFWSGGEDGHWAVLAPEERASLAIDWRRLRTEVLEPLRDGRRASWRTFNWQAGEGLSEHELHCDPAPVIVLDGAYSARPELSEVIDLAVLLTLDDSTRRQRLIAREGDGYTRRWHAIWDAAEEHYFQKTRPPHTFDMVITAD